MDYDELWYHLLGEVGDIEEAIWDKYEADQVLIEGFLDDIMPLIDVCKSPLTGKLYKGLAYDGVWLAKLVYDKDVTKARLSYDKDMTK